MTSTLPQGSPEWLEARKGKLTASNVGAALGLCSWTSRKVAYARAMGTDTFDYMCPGREPQWRCLADRACVSIRV